MITSAAAGDVVEAAGPILTMRPSRTMIAALGLLRNHPVNFPRRLNAPSDYEYLRQLTKCAIVFLSCLMAVQVVVMITWPGHR
jgi:hypothetical protein